MFGRNGMRIATSYFGNRTVRHVAADMRQLRAEGFDVVVHTMSEHDLAFHRGTMGEIVAATRDAGLEVWMDPWGVGGVFGGEAFSRIALQQPDWLQTTADGTRLPACCPSHPGFREFVAGWIAAVCEIGVDAVFWDEPQFHENLDREHGCSCRHCLQVATERDVERETPARAQLASFLEWACAVVAGEHRSSAICLLPPGDGNAPLLDWDAVARMPGVFSLGCTPFWALHAVEPERFIGDIGRRLVATTSNASIASHLWIQGFSIPVGREDEIRRAVLAAGDVAPDMIAIWGWDCCAAMSHLACGRPEIAWRTFRDAVSEL
jgi:hypothetical protein